MAGAELQSFLGIPAPPPQKKTCFSRLGWEKRRKDTRELVGLTSNRRLLKMTSLTLLPTSRASSGGRGQSAASAAAGSERERGGGLREGARRRGRSGARRRHSRCKGLASGRRSRGGTGEGERRDRLGLS